MSSGGIDNRHLFRDLTPTRSQMGGVEAPKGPQVGKMEGRGVTKNDAKNLQILKQNLGVTDSGRGGRIAQKGGSPPNVDQLKNGAKLSGVPDRDGMVRLAGRPKDDIKFLGLTIHKMSTGYKTILGGLDRYQGVANRSSDANDVLFNGTKIGFEMMQNALDELDSLSNLSDKYVKGSSHGRKDEMGALKQQIDEERQLLTKVQGEVGELENKALPPGMTIKDAISYARKGFDLEEAVDLFKAGVTPDEAGPPPESTSTSALPPESEGLESEREQSSGVGGKKVEGAKVEAPKVEPGMSREVAESYTRVGCTPKEGQLLHSRGLGPEVGKLYKDLRVPINEKTIVGGFRDANRKGGMEKLGEGAFNTVYKLGYEFPDGSKPTGVFKKEQNSPKAVGWAGGKMGIDVNNPQLGCRNLSALKTNDLLKWNVVPKVEFGIHNGELGIVMAMAPGKTRWTDKKEEITGKDAQALRQMKQLASDPFLGPAYEKQIDDAGRRMGGKILFENGKVILNRKQNEIDYKNPEVRRELVKLQWLDGIDAQGDRHGGNYLVHVDDKGRAVVTGIDNDQAEGAKITDAKQCKYGNDKDHKGYRGCGWPPVSDESMFRDIMGLTEQGIRDANEGLLSPDEINAKVDRMKGAQKHMQTLRAQGKIIPDDQWGGTKATKALNDNDSYIGRDSRGRV